jgi:glycosyltransferase involved in cell wall biosynthesis
MSTPPPFPDHLEPRMTYGDWIAAYHSSPGLEVELRRRVRALPRHPLISILLPVYNANLEFLAAALESVRRQIYTNWQLCVADDASTDPEIARLVRDAAKNDPRIAATFRETNGHIAAASNSAMALACGEWCALLDQDDVLPANALALVACEINAHADAGLIYSDEDKLDRDGVRSDPFFKPDWNPELFLAQNYINHLGVYRSDILREIGGFREGFDGSQDYDLALRFIEKLRPEQVRHIPRVLYHWRAAAGSIAADIAAKPDATNGARRAITQHLQRRGIRAHVVACREQSERHRVIYEVPPHVPLVSIIVPTRDRADLLKRCVEGIRRTDYERIEIVVVDNGSVEESTRSFLAELEHTGHARLVQVNGTFNFSRLINQGAAAARGEILVFLNNDVEVEERGWLREMVSHVLQPGVGAVGARLWFPNNTLQHGGVVLGLGGMAGHAFQRVPRRHPGYFDRLFLQQNASAATAACMMVRKSVFEETGLFDEENFTVSFNDIDFCLRLRQRGLRIVWTPYANLIHHESASRGRERTAGGQSQFFREATHLQHKWGAQLLTDPCYNQNLSLSLPGFLLAFPPRKLANDPALNTLRT